MNKLNNESKYAKFYINFQSDDGNGNIMPESIIAQNLRKSLENEDENKDILSISESIILAFELLYNKYGDENSMYAINISYHQRLMLKNLFDSSENRTTRSRFSTSAASEGVKTLRTSLHQRKQSESDIINNDETLEWILKEAIIGTEPSVLEIAKFLNNSFLRFQVTCESVYRKLCIVISERV